MLIWATSWENQQSDCAPSEDGYFKFSIIRENIIFANIREFDPSRIQHSHEMFAFIEFQ